MHKKPCSSRSTSSKLNSPLRVSGRQTKFPITRVPLQTQSKFSKVLEQVHQIVGASGASEIGLLEVGSVAEIQSGIIPSLERLEPILEELKPKGVNQISVWARLLVYLNPAERRHLNEVGRRVMQKLHANTKEIYRRRSLVRMAKSITNPPLPSDLLEELEINCLAPVVSLKAESDDLREVSTILRKAGSEPLRTVKMRAPEVRRLEQSLMDQLRKSDNLSLRAAAHYTQRLVEAWMPDLASRAESIRVRYLQRH